MFVKRKTAKTQLNLVIKMNYAVATLKFADVESGKHNDAQF
jgi:hypothetical protein